MTDLRSRDGRLAASIVLWAGASTAYGLVTGSPFRLLLGASLLVWLPASKRVGLPRNSSRWRGILLTLVSIYKRHRGRFVIAGVVFVVLAGLDCIAAMTNHDWWGAIYAALSAVALAGTVSAMPFSHDLDHVEGLLGNPDAP